MSKRKLDVAQIPQRCLGLRMRLANRVISKIYEDALRPLGLSAPQLAMLAYADQRGQLRQAGICSELQMDDSTLSRNLERMRVKGWLEESEGEDAREHPYVLTAAGKKLLYRAIPVWSEAQEQAEQLLGMSGAEALRSFAKRQGLSL